MAQRMSRRGFIAGTAAAAGTARVRAAGANEKLIVAVMGVNGRGAELAKVFARLRDAAVAYVCDVDERAAATAAALTAKEQVYQPKTVGDFRSALEDKAVDALAIAAPNHWHAPATIIACAAGKHVYVEKPCCHNPREGELMVAAARKHRRVVQMGNQRRSWPKIIEGIELVRSGAIGKAYLSKSAYASARGSIGRGKEAPAPAWLDYDLWQGPAPRRPYRDNVIHYNWHWFWHWGNGELGNNGVHSIDLCRWGLGVDFPIRVSSAGGRYCFADDQETPDTHIVTFDYDGGRTIVWEGRSCNQNSLGGKDFIASFVGDRGALVLTGSGYVHYDRDDKVVKQESGTGSDSLHIENFLACIRSGGRPNSEIEEGYKSTLLTHLGNIAYRVKRTLTCEPKDGHIVGDPEAMAFWTREYEPTWEPKV